MPACLKHALRGLAPSVCMRPYRHPKRRTASSGEVKANLVQFIRFFREFYATCRAPKPILRLKALLIQSPRAARTDLRQARPDLVQFTISAVLRITLAIELPDRPLSAALRAICDLKNLAGGPLISPLGPQSAWRWRWAPNWGLLPSAGLGVQPRFQRPGGNLGMNRGLFATMLETADARGRPTSRLPLGAWNGTVGP